MYSNEPLQNLTFHIELSVRTSCAHRSQFYKSTSTVRRVTILGLEPWDVVMANLLWQIDSGGQRYHDGYVKHLRSCSETGLLDSNNRDGSPLFTRSLIQVASVRGSVAKVPLPGKIPRQVQRPASHPTSSVHRQGRKRTQCSGCQREGSAAAWIWPVSCAGYRQMAKVIEKVNGSSAGRWGIL